MSEYAPILGSEDPLSKLARGTVAKYPVLSLLALIVLVIVVIILSTGWSLAASSASAAEAEAEALRSERFMPTQLMRYQRLDGTGEGMKSSMSASGGIAQGKRCGSLPPSYHSSVMGQFGSLSEDVAAATSESMTSMRYGGKTDAELSRALTGL